MALDLAFESVEALLMGYSPRRIRNSTEARRRSTAYASAPRGLEPAESRETLRRADRRLRGHCLLDGIQAGP